VSTSSSANSIIKDVLQGLINLLVGWLLQIGRLIPLLIAKTKVAKTRKEQSKALVSLGDAMAGSNIGDTHLVDKINSLKSSDPRGELEVEEEKLGLSGIQAGVPLLVLEDEYQVGRRAYEANQKNENNFQSISSKFWPQGPVSWFGLLAGYGLLFFGVALLFAYLAPDSMPKFLVNMVHTSKPTSVLFVEHKGVKIIVKDATIDRGFETQGATPRRADSVMFRIRLEIMNTTSEPVKYITWRGHPSRRSSQAYLNDSNGLKLDGYTSNDKLMPVGAVYEATIPPNGSIFDYLDFGTPADGFTHVDMYLPSINLNPDLQSKETLKIQLLRDDVKKPGDAVKP